MNSRQILSAFAVTLGALFFIPAAGAQTPGEVPVGGVLRDAPMRGLTGPAKSMADWRGKPLVINVWASYCPPCLAEMGSLERLSRRYKGKFNVVGISIDDYPERAQAFLAKAKTSFPHYIDHQLTLENMLGGNRIPLTVLVDANGRVLEKVYGAREWDGPEAVQLIERSFRLGKKS